MHAYGDKCSKYVEFAFGDAHNLFRARSLDGIQRTE